MGGLSSLLKVHRLYAHMIWGRKNKKVSLILVGSENSGITRHYGELANCQRGMTDQYARSHWFCLFIFFKKIWKHGYLCELSKIFNVVDNLRRALCVWNKNMYAGHMWVTILPPLIWKMFHATIMCFSDKCSDLHWLAYILKQNISFIAYKILSMCRTALNLVQRH